jgi:hypothetical protein
MSHPTRRPACSASFRRGAIWRIPARARRHSLFDTLEPRTLLSAAPVLTGIRSLSADNFAPRAAAYASDGALWFIARDLDNNGSDLVLAGADGSLTLKHFLPDADVPTLVAGDNNMLYFGDPIARTIYQYDTTNDSLHTLETLQTDDYITSVTVSGNEVWFLTAPTSGGTYDLVNKIGYINLATQHTDFLVTNAATPTLHLTRAVGISPVVINPATNQHGVYIAFSAIDGTLDGNPASSIGQSAIGLAWFDGSSVQLKTAIPTGSDFYRYMGITAITTASDGSFWFSTEPGQVDGSAKPLHPANHLVHGKFDATLTNFVSLGSYVVPGAVDEGADLGLRALSLDASGKLWFVEAWADAVGYLDTNTVTATTTDAAFAFGIAQVGTADALDTADPTTIPWAIVANPVLPSAPTDTAATIVSQTGFTWISASLPIVTFDGEAGLTFTPVEEYPYIDLPVAWFQAPEGSYEAVITWGDGTPAQVVTPQGNGANLFAVYAAKRWSSNSPADGFHGSIQIREVGGSAVGDPLTFDYAVTNTPLVLGNISTTLFNRLAMISVSFTDDVDARPGGYDATITWAPGDTSRGIIIKDPFTPGRFFIAGVHLYKKKGTYNVSVSLTTHEQGAVDVNGNPILSPLTTSTTITV